MRQEKTVKKILLELRDLSTLMTEVAFSAILKNDRNLAMEAEDLRRKIDSLYDELLISVMEVAKIGARTAESTKELASLLRIGTAISEIADGVGDIIYPVVAGEAVHPILQEVYGKDKIIEAYTINRESRPYGLKIKSLREKSKQLPPEVHFVAIKRNGEWIYDPEDETVLKEGDLVLVKLLKKDLATVRKYFA